MRKLPKTVGLLLVVCYVVWWNSSAAAQFTGNMVEGQGQTDLSGESGEQCGESVCISEASCVEGVCICPGNMAGDGSLGCSPPNWFTASVHGDPVMETFDNARVHVPFPCRYRVTHFRNPHESGPAGGTCEVQIHAYNHHIRGGYYPMGFDAEITITDASDAGNVGEVSIRKFGLEFDGQWRYLEQGKTQSTNLLEPWGSPATLTFLGIFVGCTFDEVDNFAVLSVPECGFEIQFRAFVHHTRIVPGVYVAIENRTGLEFLSPVQNLFGSPFNFGPSLLRQTKKRLGLNKMETILYLALNQNVPQDFGFGAVPCNVGMKEFIRICRTDREKAFALAVCSFLYIDGAISECLMVDEFGESTGSTFGMCVQAMCSEHADLCQDVKDELILIFQCTIPEPFASLNCSDIASTKNALYPDEI